MKRIKKLLKTPLIVNSFEFNNEVKNNLFKIEFKLLVKNLSGKDFHVSRVAESVKDDTNNSGLLSAFFAMIGDIYHSFFHCLRVMQNSLKTI